MGTPESLLASIPGELLARTGRDFDDRATARRLAEWLEERGFRPSLLELETERKRRAVAA